MTTRLPHLSAYNPIALRVFSNSGGAEKHGRRTPFTVSTSELDAGFSSSAFW
jgi:hypothetical protein